MRLFYCALKFLHTTAKSQTIVAAMTPSNDRKSLKSQTIVAAMTPSNDRTPVGQNYDGPNSLIETLRGCQTRKARTMHGELILAMTARLLSTALTTRLALSRLSESAPRSKTVRCSHSRMMFCSFDAPQQGQQGGRFRTQPWNFGKCHHTHPSKRVCWDSNGNKARENEDQNKQSAHKQTDLRFEESAFRQDEFGIDFTSIHQVGHCLQSVEQSC